MNLFLKKLSASMLCLLMAAFFCVNAGALSTNEYGLGLSVDADTADAAVLNVRLHNSNSFDVDGISFSYDVADEVIEAESATGGGAAYTVGKLEAGAAYEKTLRFSAASVEQAANVAEQSTQVQAEAAAEEGRSAEFGIAAGIAAVVILAAALLLIKHKKKATALILVFSLLVPSLGMLGVHAVGVRESRSFTLESVITLGEKEYPVSFTVEYIATSEKNSYFDFDISQDDQAEQDNTQSKPAVTRPNTSISGTAKADGSVKEVTYEIRNKDYEDSVTGTAQLDGCEWNAETLPLREGENEIVVKAELDTGETRTQVYNVSYDSGEIYKPLDFEIVTDDKTVYVENVINIYFETDTTDERIEQILAEQKLVRIGESNGILLVQARAKVETLDELKAICDKLCESYAEVKVADIEEILDIEINSVPDDPWYHDTVSNPVKWSETAPGGTNWSVEAVEALSAWKYEKYFNTAVAGVIDGGFYTGHEDFDSLISFPETCYENYNNSLDSESKQHGTHVAGIIGATRNNTLGGSGLLNDVTLYATQYNCGESTSVGNILQQLDVLVTAGAKAVNISLGLTPNAYGTYHSESALKSGASQCAAAVDTLLDNGYEFVVVQSAGNGAYDSRIGTMFLYGSTKGSVPNRSIDAYQNGLFCSIRNDKSSYYYGSLTSSEVQAVYDRIVVVGAVTGYYCSSAGPQFRMWHCSSGGDRVDIYAPGHNVFSTIPDVEQNEIIYHYAYLSGTSQAAPIVTSVAAMCFAINPAFTGAQVKDIICDPENSTHTAYDASIIYTNDEGTQYDLHPFTGDGQLISMKLCAEASLRYVCGKASYTYFNQVMSAVDSLNPDDYTNYEVLQAVLDTIDSDFYNLYEFEQDKVSAKANEIIAAMDKLVEKEKADYTAVEQAIAAANALNPDYYVDFSGVTAAINAVVYGKYADEQTEVDAMAQAINDAIASLENLAEITSENSYIIPDNELRCVVTTCDMVGDMSVYLSAGAWYVEHIPDANGSYSTGSVILLSDSSGREIEYYVAVIGDVDSDADNDAEDAYIVSLCVAGIAPEPQAALFPAYDADCNGIIDGDDVVLLNEAGVKENEIFNCYCPGGNG